MSFTFNSYCFLGKTLPPFSQEKVKNEPMLFNCDYEYARKLGGPITHAFLDLLQLDGPIIIDSRVHMLKRGWWPCIPGWHHDDVPRSRADGQPNYKNPEYESFHCLALINGGIAPTEFALGTSTFNEVPIKQTVYKVWHGEVEKQLLDNRLMRYQAESNRLIYFDWQTWHQGTRAVTDGWRFFIRASAKTNRKPTNEIRRQVQVYLDLPMEGW